MWTNSWLNPELGWSQRHLTVSDHTCQADDQPHWSDAVWAGMVTLGIAVLSNVAVIPFKPSTGAVHATAATSQGTQCTANMLGGFVAGHTPPVSQWKVVFWLCTCFYWTSFYVSTSFTLCQLAPFTFHVSLYSSCKLMLTCSSWLNNYLYFGVLMWSLKKTPAWSGKTSWLFI